MAHITGGGLSGNVSRILPQDIQVQIDSTAWQRPAIFNWIQTHGDIEESEMLRTFNCGIGMIIAVKEKDIDAASSLLNSMNLTNKVLGEVSKNKGNKASIEIV